MDKKKIKDSIVESLKDQKEINKIIVFGSFNSAEEPNDIDIAVVQESTLDYLTLALKYRKLIRGVSKLITVDIFPVIEKADDLFYKNEIATGEVIYARVR